VGWAGRGEVGFVTGQRTDVATATRVVVKIGSSSLTTADGQIDDGRIASLAEVLVGRVRAGSQVVLVSSGAIAAGLVPLGLLRRPRDLATQQAAASVGQGLLMARYSAAFATLGVQAGQILLTADDLMRRAHYRNAQRTLGRLLELGILPVVNENDTVATDEIRFGDNDRLAALVAHVIRAGALILLSDVDGLYDIDPRRPGARRITRVGNRADLAGVSLGPAGRTVRADGAELGAVALGGAGTSRAGTSRAGTSRAGTSRAGTSGGAAGTGGGGGGTGGGGGGTGGVGTGGMITKVDAALIATEAGIPTVVARADQAADALAGEPVGTYFAPHDRRPTTRQLWLAHAAVARGRLVLDPGAVRAVLGGRASLLPAGITGAEGTFDAGDPVDLCDPGGQVVARGLVNYDVAEIPALMGRSTRELAAERGPEYEREVVHRDDLVLLVRHRRETAERRS
jgi:glutamate 5-kinase